MTIHSYNPKGVVTAVFHTSSGFINVWKNKLVISILTIQCLVCSLQVYHRHGEEGKHPALYSHSGHGNHSPNEVGHLGLFLVQGKQVMHVLNLMVTTGQLSHVVRGPSVQICARYEDNIVTKCCLRRPSGCPADYTLYMM